MFVVQHQADTIYMSQERQFYSDGQKNMAKVAWFSTWYVFSLLTLCKIFIVWDKTNLFCLFQGGPKPRHAVVVAAAEADKENSSPPESEEKPPTIKDEAAPAAAPLWVKIDIYSEKLIN